MKLRPKILLLSLRFFLVIGITVAIPFGIRHYLQTCEWFSLGMFPLLWILLSAELGTGVFMRVISVRIHEQFILSYFFGRKKVYPANAICGFSKTVFSTRFIDFPGIIIYTRKGRHIEISGMNVKSVDQLPEMLTACFSVKCFGDELSHFSVFRGKHRYDDRCK